MVRPKVLRETKAKLTLRNYNDALLECAKAWSAFCSPFAKNRLGHFTGTHFSRPFKDTFVNKVKRIHSLADLDCGHVTFLGVLLICVAILVCILLPKPCFWLGHAATKRAKASVWQTTCEILWSMPELAVRPDISSFNSSIRSCKQGNLWVVKHDVDAQSPFCTSW